MKRMPYLERPMARFAERVATPEALGAVRPACPPMVRATIAQAVGQRRMDQARGESLPARFDRDRRRVVAPREPDLDG